MSSFFYDGQVRRYLTQFMRAMNNFAYQDGNGGLHQVPVMYGDPNRQASSLLKKNSENTIPSAPFIACYIKALDYDQSRLQDPTYVGKVQIRERAYNETTGQYEHVQGSGYTVERIMPAPYKLTFTADIWTTNTEQKLQIFEQIAYLFRPALELQTTDNYIDWTSLTVLTLTNTLWTSRQIPQGTEQNIDILTLTFETPIWITPPAKVKKMGIITKIIANIFADTPGTIANDFNDPDTVYSNLGEMVGQVVVTPGDFELLVLDGVGGLLTNEIASAANDGELPGNIVSWYKLIDLYPGQFRPGLSQIRLLKADGNEVVAYITLDTYDEKRMILTYDADTIPANTILTSTFNSSGRGNVDAIINPETFNPKSPIAGTRYLILEDIPPQAPAWQNSDSSQFVAVANDIIEWDGNFWNIIFDSTVDQPTTYITNSYTSIQYKWDGASWSKSYEGIYDKFSWRLIL